MAVKKKIVKKRKDIKKVELEIKNSFTCATGNIITLPITSYGLGEYMPIELEDVHAGLEGGIFSNEIKDLDYHYELLEDVSDSCSHAIFSHIDNLRNIMRAHIPYTYANLGYFYESK